MSLTSEKNMKLTSEEVSKKIEDFEKMIKNVKQTSELNINYDDLGKLTRIHQKLKGIIELNEIFPKKKKKRGIR